MSSPVRNEEGEEERERERERKREREGKGEGKREIVKWFDWRGKTHP